MKEVFYIRDIDSLRIVSDPLRVDILLTLGTTAKSGQELSKEMDINRSKIHYHLNELEKKGFIEVVKTDVVNGIIQKYYLPVAKAFIPDISLFNSEFFEGYKEIEVPKDEYGAFQSEINEVLEKYSNKKADKKEKITLYIGKS